MEVYFNELCLNESTCIQYEDVLRMKILYDRLYKKKIHVCRISREGYWEILQQARRMKGTNPTVINFLYAFMRQPYEETSVEERQDEYLSHSWRFRGKDCYGLALARIMDSLAVSICDVCWKQNILMIEKDEVAVEVRNLYDEDTFSYHVEWLEALSPIELVKCMNRPKEKRIKLRDDHGKDVLQEFSNRIVQSEYVCEVVNSLPYNSGNRRFIHRIGEDGILELVLPWTDRGLGLAVKTTGRNYRETEKIAEILKEQYGSL